MTTTYISCDSFQNKMLSGFIRLQEQQEFVDLTLAADGHLVKVHKNIVALASPYIKEMLKSASSHNPIIFLNNVRHNVLVYLLEYIYQGEVKVPVDSLESFIEVSQSLHISGFGKGTQSKLNQNAEMSTTQSQSKKPVVSMDLTNEKTERPSNIAASITINSNHNFEVQQFVENIQVLDVEDSFHAHKNNELHQIVTKESTIQENMPLIDEMDNITCDEGIRLTNEMENTSISQMNYNMEIDANFAQDSQIRQNLGSSNIDLDTSLIHLTQPLAIDLDKEASDALRTLTLYSVTQRGRVQIIVSRFIYCNHNSSRGGRLHRWRCADYRKLRCPALIDSVDDKIVLRKGVHNHRFHDNRILKKTKLGKIYHSLKQAEDVTKLPANSNVYLDDDDEDDDAQATELPNDNVFHVDNDEENTDFAPRPNISSVREDDDFENVIEFSAISRAKKAKRIHGVTENIL